MHSSLRLDIRLLSYSIVRNPWNSLIPLSRGSFDVLVGMDRLSKRKFVIVCHEKEVRILLKGDEILRVHGERTQGVVKTLLNTKKGRVKLRRVREMSMTIQSSVKDKILATLSETSKVENAPAEMLRDLDQQMEKRADDVKPRRVRAMAMTIQYGVRGMLLTAQSEAFKEENVPLVGSEMDMAHASRFLVHPRADKKYYNLGDILRYLNENEIESPWILSLNFQDNSKEWNSGDDQLRLRWMIYLMVLADAAKSVRDVIGFEYCLASSSGWTKVLPWKGVVRFGKKGKLAPRYVGLFEILERIDLVAYRLRLPEELNSVHDTFHVSNLKKCLADANLHVSLNEIKINKTLRFVEELVEIMDCEVKSLKCNRIPLVKVRWNSKRGPEFT
ncbi:hypothetical protein Tco_1274858 [Tanacetum coccineum]